MPLRYKPDWEETKQRYRAWWAGEVLDRCAIAVYAFKDHLPLEEPPKPPERVSDRWFDYDYLAAVNERNFHYTFLGGEALPIWNPGYPGWAGIPTFLGCPVTLDETTGWIEPILTAENLSDYDFRKLVINPADPWWARALEMLRFSAREARDISLPTTGAFGGSGDTLASLRGTERLLMDLVECPEYVRKIELYLMRQWCEVFDVFHAITRDAAEGSTGWFDLWSPGKFYASHNDFAYMISPAMFRDIFLPALELQTNFLDHTVHHVDGIGNFAHVPALCELPRLQALQILPGAGKPSPLHYMDVLKYVQTKGKNLHISISQAEVETAISELSINGLFIQTWCGSEAEARELLSNVERWSAKRCLLQKQETC